MYRKKHILLNMVDFWWKKSWTMRPSQWKISYPTHKTKINIKKCSRQQKSWCKISLFTDKADKIYRVIPGACLHCSFIHFFVISLWPLMWARSIIFIYITIMYLPSCLLSIHAAILNCTPDLHGWGSHTPW